MPLNTFCRISRRSTSATRGELDISAISIHAYAYVSDQYACYPAGRYGRRIRPDAGSQEHYSKEEIAGKNLPCPVK